MAGNPQSVAGATPGSTPLLDVRGLTVEFRARDGVARAADAVDLQVPCGRTVAVIGESGCGKSVTAAAIMGIVAPPGKVTAGEILFNGVDVLTLDDKARRALRGVQMSMVFQDAPSALNPVMQVGKQIAEMFRVHQGMGRKEAFTRAVELMDAVRIPSAASRARDYPHQFSGGMRQRVMIAMAIALKPQLLIADEPTTALDVTVQAQILQLLAELKGEMDMSVLLITHDLGVASQVADDVVVMYAGRVVERGPLREVFAQPGHPYTRALLDSVPGRHAVGELPAIPGMPPRLTRMPPGCAFASRCGFAAPPCVAGVPALVEIRPGRDVACVRAAEVAR
jgi:oligopeptide transport system ATP-binding protein